MNKKYNKEDVLLNSVDLLRHNGFNNTGINEILAHNQIPKGSFYNFFSSKEDFVIQLLGLYVETMEQNMDVFFQNTKLTPINRLRGLYRNMIDSSCAEGHKDGCLLNNTTSEIGGLNEAISVMADECYSKIINKVAACIDEGQQLGEIRSDIEAIDLATYIQASFSGASIRMKASRSGDTAELVYSLIFKYLEAK